MRREASHAVLPLAGRRTDGHARSLKGLVSYAFLASLADLDALAPFRVQDLVRADSAAGIGIQYAVDHVAAAGLTKYVSKWPI